MKIIAVVSLIAFPFITTHQSANGSPKPFEFTLEITANLQQDHSLEWDFVNQSTTIRTGAIVQLAVKKTNTSHQEILKFTMPYGWTVRDPKGDRLAPRRAEGRDGWIRGGGPGMLMGTKEMYLQPGEAIIAGYPLSGFDLSQPGTYTVQISQHVSSDQNSSEIQSNIITITVLPAQKSRP